MNTQAYVKLLGGNLIDYAKELYADNRTYKQDSVPINIARLIKDFFNRAIYLCWGAPPMSPDLNPIKDLWGILSIKIFSKSKQYSTFKELELEILSELGKIDITTLRKLVVPMPRRLQQVLIHKDDAIPC